MAVLGAPRAAQRQAGHADPLAAPAHDLLGQLDRLDQIVVGVEVEEGHEPAVDGPRRSEVAPFEGGDQGDGFLGEGAGQARHPTRSAQHQPFQRDVVETGHQGVALAIAVGDVGEAARIGGAFLDGDDVRDVGQLVEDVEADAHPVGRRVIVEHDRQAGGASDGTEVRFQFVGCRDVHHGGKKHQRVGADGLGVAGELNGARRGELRNADDDGRAAVRRFTSPFQDRPLLIGLQRVVLAAGPKHHQPVHAVVEKRLLD